MVWLNIHIPIHDWSLDQAESLIVYTKKSLFPIIGLSMGVGVISNLFFLWNTYYVQGRVGFFSQAGGKFRVEKNLRGWPPSKKTFFLWLPLPGIKKGEQT